MVVIYFKLRQPLADNIERKQACMCELTSFPWSQGFYVNGFFPEYNLPNKSASLHFQLENFMPM